MRCSMQTCFIMGYKKKTNSDVLYALNTKLMNTYPKLNIPKCDIKTFNHDEYVKKLTEWVNNVYHQTMKRYGSVVSYYVDNLKIVGKLVNYYMHNIN
jgi:hypothetical protein